MTHTIDDLWDQISVLCDRLTTLETQYATHIEKGRRKRETIAYIIATGISILALAEYFVV